MWVQVSISGKAGTITDANSQQVGTVADQKGKWMVTSTHATLTGVTGPYTRQDLEAAITRATGTKPTIVVAIDPIIVS